MIKLWRAHLHVHNSRGRVSGRPRTGRSSTWGDHTSQRAAARKAAAQRAAAGRRNPPPVGAAAAPGDASSLDGCIRLVAAAMAEVGGEAVSEDDENYVVSLRNLNVVAAFSKRATDANVSSDVHKVAPAWTLSCTPEISSTFA